MFYLETKDGEKFFTGKDSDDKAEFERILEDKLGPQAVALFNDLVMDSAWSCEELLSDAASRLESITYDLNALITKSENCDKVETSDIEAILSDVQRIEADLRTL